jgi:hypothetical protein
MKGVPEKFKLAVKLCEIMGWTNQEWHVQNTPLKSEQLKQLCYLTHNQVHQIESFR